MIGTPNPIDDSVVRANDVLCGRGGATNNHSGNKRFRELVRAHQPRYLLVKKNDKSKIARRIVSIVRERGGRFLRRNDTTGSWVDIGDKKATEKTSQALREGLDVRNRTGPRPRRNSESSIEDGHSSKRRKMTTYSYEDSPSLVSDVGDAMPDLDEEISEKIMPQFIYHSPPVSTDDCDDVAEV